MIQILLRLFESLWFGIDSVFHIHSLPRQLAINKRF